MSLFSSETLEHMRDCASQYATGVHQLITGVLWLEKENAELKAKVERTEDALGFAFDELNLANDTNFEAWKDALIARRAGGE